MVALSARSLVLTSEWRVGELGIAVRGYHRPAVEVILAREGQVHRLLGSFSGYVDATCVVEDAVHLGIFPELVDRDKGVRERWHAAYVSDEDSTPHAGRVAYESWEVSDALDPLRLAVDAGHGVSAWALVDQVVDVGVAVP